MIYEKSNEAYSDEVFLNPPREYRGAPFWAWNGRLEERKLCEQMACFQKMGFGGFHIHARIGLETEYLGEEFLKLVKRCNEFGDDHDLNTWLYDEDKWPSGAGGGRVTCHEQYAARYLLFSPNEYEEGFLDRKIVATSRLSKNGRLKKLMGFDVELKDGRLSSYKVLREGETGKNPWYAYVVVTEKLRWFNNQPYVDTLNPEAIKKFIEVTHERYKEAVGDEFGNTVPAIFTDEPGYHKQENFADSRISQDVGIAYTDGMEECYKNRFKESLLEHLPEIFWNLEDGRASHVRYQYHDCASQMFADGYMRTLAQWCDAHKLMLTGHVLFEGELESQAQVGGEVMRVLSPMTLPGIDMLADRHEYTTAKQAQSISHQYGRPGVMSELYGVTNWDYDFRGHKAQGDWQAALGVTLRVPHLAWMTMGGESKRDYPAPIDSHSVWYDKYHLIEDYFARVNTVMTRGKAVCRIGVIHPIESMWMAMGPDNETASMRKHLEENFSHVTGWLLFGLLDFDYVSEALMTELYEKSEDGRLHLGNMAYDVVVLPGLTTVRRTTLEYLEEFVSKGGRAVVMGEAPAYVDGRPSEEAKALAEKWEVIGFDKWQLLHVLEPLREVDIRLKSEGLRADRLLTQLRQDGQERWLFIAQGKPDTRKELNHWFTMTGREDMVIRIKGTYQVRQYDAQSGSIEEVPARYEKGWTYVEHGFYAQDSLLLRLTPAKEAKDQAGERPKEMILREGYLNTVTDYCLYEPNVMMLDQAQYRMDEGPWQPKEELLRLDDAVRRTWGYGLRTESFPQPWLKPKNPPEHVLELCFSFVSEVELECVELAFEAKDRAELIWNGDPVEQKGGRFYVDEAIHLEKLGRLKKGENTLMMKLPYGPDSDVEWCYLLGEFGVKVQGGTSVITEKPKTLAFGDMAVQGFPFYGGKADYITELITEEEGWVELEIPEYFGALVTAKLDGESKDVFAQPCKVRFGHRKPGTHKLVLTIYGTRINTFGQVHNCNRKEEYYGPKSYRTTGKNWNYVYQLRQTGITLAPIWRILSNGETRR